MGASRPLECALWDDNEVVQPVIEGSPFYIATRVTESNETQLCATPPDGGSCPLTYGIACDKSFKFDPHCKAPAQHSFYPADVENFTLLVDHSVRAPKIPSVHASAFEMTGVLQSCSGTEVTPPSTTEGQDLFTLGQLLDTIEMPDGSCGLQLDAPSTVNGSSNSIRYDGAILVLNIEYTNIKPWSGVQDNVTYIYKLDLLAGTKSKVTQQIWKEFPTQRVTRNQHGLKLVVIQTGRLGIFDFTNLLVQLTTTLTLFTATTTLVDMLAIWCVRCFAARYMHNAYTASVWLPGCFRTGQRTEQPRLRKCSCAARPGPFSSTRCGLALPAERSCRWVLALTRNRVEGATRAAGRRCTWCMAAGRHINAGRWLVSSD